MPNEVVKIIDIDIKNYKNVESGYVKFDSDENIENGLSSIMGLYGQNGSGKTTVIDAIRLTKEMISGDKLSDDIINYINVNSNYSKIKILFYIKSGDKRYKVEYSFKIEKNINNKKDRITVDDYLFQKEEDHKKYCIAEEKIRYWEKDKVNNPWNNVKTLMEISKDRQNVFPKYRRDEIIKESDTPYFIKMNYDASAKENRSFLFSEEIVDSTRNINMEYEMLSILKKYMKYNLIIIDNRTMGLSDANLILPINIRSVKNKSNGRDAIGVIPISLEENSLLPVELVKSITRVIESSNLVLNQIIPGFSVEVRELGTEINSKGIELLEFQLLSVRRNDKVGLKYESDGIKKIVAIIHVLTAMYNYEFMTVLIDEFDAGIFEFLLGELLSILEDRAKGQLIFTSHNLRPLEVLNKENLTFTTANPKNRYIKLKGVKSNNNLRDKYYRDLVLNGQDEIIYDKTSEFKINRALRKAGVDA